MAEPAIRLLETVWDDLIALGEDLGDEEWALPTDCPGWSVQDNVAHVIGTERMLAGDPAPEGDFSEVAHVRNDIGAFNEAWVAARRDRSGAEVLVELRQVTGERLTALRAMTTEDFGKLGFSPVGEVPSRDFMRIRAMDSWSHAMDIRDATGRPGGWEGGLGPFGLAMCSRSMPMVVGKRAAAPDGATLVFSVTGPIAEDLAVGVDGRAAVLEAVPSEPTVTLTMAADVYRRLTQGRRDGAAALAEGEVEVHGDDVLGRRVVTAMSTMI